ncbi:hypothetical protein FGG08_000737 [Glutinoglossum americanum]|uniref:Uncharacterized protein n=1 Tax=Glutinoglossum americanum TaxID=1670608 RepID=A0A9P8ICB2_9PEZI|nr:hypothetical protein FGG08_000737 [Glutinoglossum americanum]
MTYNNFPSSGALGVPGSGFASRGKGSHIKRISVAPPKLSDDGLASGAPTPRTSRSHLLAGLRTAPKSPAFPPSAPPEMVQRRTGFSEGIRYPDQENVHSARNFMPKTASGAFPVQVHSPAPLNPGRQVYSLPEQVLAPPAIHVANDQGEEHMDPNLYAELLATNLYLAQQQQRLQQQLINVTAAAQQFQGLNLNGQTGLGQQQMFATPPMTPNMGLYHQQLRSGMQPVITPVSGMQPGFYSVYNPMTGQHGYYIDPAAQQTHLPASPAPSTTRRDLSNSPPLEANVKAQVSSPPASSSPMCFQRSGSPPRTSDSPAQSSPSLPPSTANAFRRGHKKCSSLSLSANANSMTSDGGPKSSIPKTAGIPQTPTTGTFGPGQARVGEHPSRQPRGPPPLDELKEKPTTKHEGSKNFATRQRRRAVHSLVRAGIERRGARGAPSTGSMTPVSENEVSFAFSSDNDTDSVGSGSLSGKPSIGSLRAAANGAIGSEREKRKERSLERRSVDSQFTATSVSSDEGASVGGKLLEVKIDVLEADNMQRRKTPMLVLSSAEKRKTTLF